MLEERTRAPITQEAAGSSPVAHAIDDHGRWVRYPKAVSRFVG